MLKVTEIRVDLTRNGPEKYESDVIGLTAVPEEGVNVQDAIGEMKRLILGKFEVNKNTSTTKAKVSSEKTSATKVAEPVKSESTNGEGTVSEAKAPVETETKVEKQAPAKEEKEEKATKAKVKVKGKATPYDRSVDTHKKHLGEFLNAAFPTWQESSNIAKAGIASKALVGTDFLDAEGEMLQSFKDAFLQYLRA